MTDNVIYGIDFKAKQDDGIALTNIEHPPGLIESTAEAIRDGRLKLLNTEYPDTAPSEYQAPVKDGA